MRIDRLHSISSSNIELDGFALGDSGSRHVNHLDPDATQCLFKPGSSSTFVIEAVDLLDVTKIMVTKGRGADLSIMCVKVKKAEFAPEEWIFDFDE